MEETLPHQCSKETQAASVWKITNVSDSALKTDEQLGSRRETFWKTWGDIYFTYIVFLNIPQSDM